MFTYTFEVLTDHWFMVQFNASNEREAYERVKTIPGYKRANLDLVYCAD